jgi:serine/threonine protein kinase
MYLYRNSIFMEHVPGGTLRDLIVNMAQLPEAVASIYTHQLLLGLAFLHSCGATHHTLCAANVSTIFGVVYCRFFVLGIYII